MKNKVLAFIFLCLFVLNIFGTLNIVTVQATPQTPSNISELKQAIDQKLKFINDMNIKGVKGLNGLLYNLEVILRQTLWADFISSEQGLNYSNEIKEYQKQKTLSNVKKFNEIYSEDTDTYDGLTINKFLEDRFDLETLVTDIAGYTASVLDKMVREAGDSPSDAKIKEITNKYQSELRYIYQICNLSLKEVESINSLIPYIKSDDGSLKPIWKYTPAVNPLVDVLENDRYRKFMDAGKELSKKDLDKINVGALPKGEVLQKFFINGDYKGGELHDAYFAMLSAGATYEPFVSKVGDDNYIRALKTLVNDPQGTGEVVQLFNEVSKYKKPLFMREYFSPPTSISQLSSTAKRVTLKKFVESIEGDLGAKVYLVKGVLKSGSDMNSYRYYHEQRFINNFVHDTESNTNTEESNTNLSEEEKKKKEEEKKKKEEEEKKKKEELKEKDEDTQYIIDAEEISDLSRLTDVVFEWGTGDFETNAHLGKLLARNIINDRTKKDDFASNSRFLFMNAFGDIVTDDDVVIIPGAANPTLLNKGQSYFPYTMAFMKSYPHIDPHSKVFNVLTPRADGKMVLSIDVAQQEEVTTLSNEILLKDNNREVYVRELTGQNSLGFGGQHKTDIKLQTATTDLGGGLNTLTAFKTYEFKSGLFNLGGIWDEKMATTSGFGNKREAFMIKLEPKSISESTTNILFNSSTSQLTDQELGLIASNFFWSIKADSSGALQAKPNGRYNTLLMAQSIIPEALNGHNNARSYSNATAKSMSTSIEESFGRFKLFVKRFMEDLITSIGKAVGVLGLQDGYQNPLISNIRTFLIENFKQIALGIFTFVMLGHWHSRREGLSAITWGIISVGVFAVFTYILPIYFPVAYNGISRYATEDLTYRTLMRKVENYKVVYNDKQDRHGRFISATTSLNLYKLTDSQLTDLCDKLKILKSDILKGKAFVLDNDSGVYLEGNIIKVNIDKLFKNNPITGKYEPMGSGGESYKITSEKAISSNIDYYTVYHLLTDSFINQLNKFASIYPLNSSTINYGDISKDSFMINSYVQSIVVAGEGKWELLESSTDPTIITALEEAFPIPKDFLGLFEMFSKLPKVSQDSLWYRTLEQNNRLGEKELTELIEHTNKQTLQFIIKNLNVLSNMSDENSIKIISLYATGEFNSKAGTFSNMMYPIVPNAEELNLNDALVSVYTNDYDMFASDDLDILTYVANNYGVTTLMVFGIGTGLMSICIHLTTFLIALLYLLLCVVLIFKIIKVTDITGVFKGFIKSSLVVFICFLLQSCALLLASFMAGSAIAFYVVLGIAILVLELECKLIVAVFSRPLEIGHGNMGIIMPWLGKLLRVDTLMSNVAQKVKSVFNNKQVFMQNVPDHLNQYKYDTKNEDYYSSPAFINKVIKVQEQNNAKRKEDINEIMDDKPTNDNLSDYHLD